MNVFFKTVVATLFGVALTIILLFTTNMPNKSNNGFDRYFLAVKPEILSNVNLSFPSKEIIHLDKSGLLISTDSSNIILLYKYPSNQIEYLRFKIDPDLRSRIGKVHSFVYNPKNENFTLFTNNLHGFLIFNKDSFHFTKLGDKAYYYAVAIGSNSYILRQFEKKRDDAIFVRISVQSDTQLKEEKTFLKSQDRGFSTDGHLLYNIKNGLLSYMHYYNNEILSFDTTLNLIKRFRTIDTISYKEKLNQEKPLLVSNKKSFVYGDYIFICSNLRADNESMKNYLKNIPIDIYNVRTGTYKGSIYVPISYSKLIRSLRYDGEILAAIYYDNSLIIFQMPIESFGF